MEPLRLKTGERAPEERVPLFYIDELEVTIPPRFSASFGLRYIDIVTERGLDAGVVWLLKNALSPGGYEALLGYDDLEPEQFSAIVESLQAMVVGALEKSKGKLRSA
jgi:hypothetical protein